MRLDEMGTDIALAGHIKEHFHRESEVSGNKNIHVGNGQRGENT